MEILEWSYMYVHVNNSLSGYILLLLLGFVAHYCVLIFFNLQM